MAINYADDKKLNNDCMSFFRYELNMYTTSSHSHDKNLIYFLKPSKQIPTFIS